VAKDAACPCPSGKQHLSAQLSTAHSPCCPQHNGLHRAPKFNSLQCVKTLNPDPLITLHTAPSACAAEQVLAQVHSSFKLAIAAAHSKSHPEVNWLPLGALVLTTSLLAIVSLLPFSAKCLKNRHGEDCAAADASGAWWCPCCRGSCGAGCVGCCNCGFCRKKVGAAAVHTFKRAHQLLCLRLHSQPLHPSTHCSSTAAVLNGALNWSSYSMRAAVMLDCALPNTAPVTWHAHLTCCSCCCTQCLMQAGLEPTHQVVRLARDAGFDNVHDYLVHLVTGEALVGVRTRQCCSTMTTHTCWSCRVEHTSGQFALECRCAA
jgi:hypothetical protein